MHSTWHKLKWPLIALALALVFNAIFSPGFFHFTVRDGRLYGSVIDILNRAAPVMLLALGMTLVIATGGVDLSVGAVMAITGAAAALLLTKAGMNVPAVIGISLLIAMTAASDVRRSWVGPGVGSGLAPDLVRLGLVVVVDGLYVLGVLLPYVRRDAVLAAQWGPDIMAVPILLTVIFLPWVTIGSAAFSGYRLWRGASAPLSRGICLSVVVLGAAGFVSYISPLGVAASRWLTA
jgi:ribose/xylose/arabinose/galactoside ABC-type transport system permease subunit